MLKKLGRGLKDIISTQKKVVLSPKAEPTPVARLAPIKPATEAPLKPPEKHKEISILTHQAGGTERGVSWLHTDTVIPNRFQPRQEFDPESLKELTDSIKVSGVIQPILVRKSNNQYELIAGERRWRACRTLKLDKVPAIVKEADDKTMLEWAIIENTQRKDLNPIERARAYKQLTETFKLTHEEIANRMGIERSTVTNFMRLLELPMDIQEEVSRGTLTMGHARAILSVPDKDNQLKIVRRIKKEGMSVRRLEYVIRYLKRRKKDGANGSASPHLKELEDRLRRAFGTKVSITAYKSKGYITIHFYSDDDFQRILEKLES